MRTPRHSTPSHSSPTQAGPLDDRSRFGLSGTGGRRAGGFGAAGVFAGVLAAAVLVGGLVWSATTGQAPPAQRPKIFGGSLVLDDYRPLTVIDLATGAVTVQLEGVYAQVGASSYSEVEAVPTTDGTMLVNRVTGAFNMLAQDNYVLGPPTNGISLGPLAGETAAAGYAAGPATYIVRFAPDSTVSLVDASTVVAGAQALATRPQRPVRPLGFAQLAGEATNRPGGAAVDGGALWLLRSSGRKCDLDVVAPSTRSTHGLSVTTRSIISQPCRNAALESSSGSMALALPGKAELFGAKGVQRTALVEGTAKASELLPVRGARGEMWFFARLPTGWSVFGIAGTGEVTGPHPLAAFGPGSEVVEPAYSAGRAYTLVENQPGQPTLWAIDPATGAMRPVPGATRYPAASITEKASFHGAQVLVDGPRVIFNNPESLLAVVVFTDSGHKPVIVDKATAVIVSAAGPGDANVKLRKQKHKHPARPQHHRAPAPAPAPATVPTTTPTTIAQPVTQQVNCATTTEKPYEPQIVSVSPSDGSALVVWSYHLLDEQDCLPRTWTVRVLAAGGAPQPRHPVQAVDGQQQLLFTGLRPGTRYEAFVTAYIAKQSTASTPYAFVTTAIGPGPPEAVRTVANGHAGWVVSWSPCSGPRCEVAATSWRVTGTSCGGGFVGQPPTIVTAGPRTSVTINAGNDLGLLGSSLSFSVQGVSSQGLVGLPSSDGRCSQAWEPPDPGDLQLLAAGTPVGQTVTAELKVVVAPNASATSAFGGDQVTYSYGVSPQGPGAKGPATQVLGPTSSSQVYVPGLSPATTYSATVTITPVGHPAAAVTIASRPFDRTIAWPSGLRMDLSSAVGANPDTGTALATFVGLPSGTFQGIGALICGSESLPLNGPVVDAKLSVGVNLEQMGGRCTMSLTLRSTLTPDPYGVPSPTFSAGITLGAQPTYAFAAVADATCLGSCPTVQLIVSYDGSGRPAGTRWLVTAASAPGCRASSALQAAPHFPVTLKWPLRCSVPTVTVSWFYLGASESATASRPFLPSPPSTTTTTTPRPVTTTTTTATTTSAPPRSAPTTVATTVVTPLSTPAPTAPPATVPTPTTTASTTTVPTTTTPPTTPAPTTTTTPPTTPVPTTTTTPPTTTTTTTTTPPTTTTTTTTTTPTTTTPTTTTTTPTTTTTTTTTSTTTPPSATTTTTPHSSSTTTTPTTTTTTTLPPPKTTGSSGAALSAFTAGREHPGRGPQAPPGMPAAATALLAGLLGILLAVCATSLGWCVRRAPRSRVARSQVTRDRRRTYPAMEATT